MARVDEGKEAEKVVEAMGTKRRRDEDLAPDASGDGKRTKRRKASSSSSTPDGLHGSDTRRASGASLSPSIPTITESQSSNALDRLSILSDELLIRILHHLPLPTILLLQSVSHRFGVLATDSQVWKSLYYARFVLPRVKRLPRKGEITDEVGEGRWCFSSRRSRWLDEGSLLEWGDGRDDDTSGEGRIRRGRGRTDWKARYRLRHNWSRGKAEVRRFGLGVEAGRDAEDDLDSEDELEESQSKAEENRLMVRLVNGLVVTADKKEGLRAWDVKDKKRDTGSPLASVLLPSSPSSLGVDSAMQKDGTTIVVGFSNGGFGLWSLRDQYSDMRFKQQFLRPGTTKTENRALTAVSYSYPYLLTISTLQVLSLYSFATPGSETSTNILPDPELLASLTSHTTWPPLALSIRSTPTSIIASIAYALPTYTSGWSVGLQELHLSPENGTILQSRLATATESGFHSLLSSPSSPSGSSTPISSSTPQTTSNTPSRRANDGRGHPLGSGAKPTSLSYAHPYLLAAHGDNTLTLYLVQSSPEELKIGKGVKLWGHTSEVAGAMIGGRGKAVSVGGGPGGGEVRVWELEGGRAASGAARGGGSVRIRGEFESDRSLEGDSGDGGFGVREREREQLSTPTSAGRKGWVGFDDEVVVVMKEAVPGGEGSALLVYDFT